MPNGHHFITISFRSFFLFWVFFCFVLFYFVLFCFVLFFFLSQRKGWSWPIELIEKKFPCSVWNEKPYLHCLKAWTLSDIRGKLYQFFRYFALKTTVTDSFQKRKCARRHNNSLCSKCGPSTVCCNLQSPIRRRSTWEFISATNKR